MNENVPTGPVNLQTMTTDNPVFGCPNCGAVACACGGGEGDG